MKIPFPFVKIIIFVILLSSAFYLPNKVFAAALTDVSVDLSDNHPAVNSNFSLTFKLSTDSLLKQVKLNFDKSISSSDKPPTMDLSSTTLAGLTGLTNGWTLNSSSASSGILDLVSDTGDTKSIGDTIVVNLNTIKNAEINECTNTTNGLYDDCYISIGTYSDSGETLVDEGGVSYHLEDIPFLSFTIEGVDSGTLTNGMITSKSTTTTIINFGSVEIHEPVSAAQKLTSSTSSPGGYNVTMKLDGYLQGLSPNNKIDPFAALNAAWTSPQEWESPDGTVPNTDTGWIGANTSDIRVPDWDDAASKFGPVSSTAHSVMHSDSRDRSGTQAYVTYALEINESQPPDSYVGTIIYNIVNTY